MDVSRMTPNTQRPQLLTQHLPHSTLTTVCSLNLGAALESYIELRIVTIVVWFLLL